MPPSPARFAKAGFDRARRRVLADEWAAYRSLAGDPRTSAIAPRPLGWDGSVLAVEALTGCDLKEAVIRDDSVDEAVGRQVGHALALLHMSALGDSLRATAARTRVKLHKPDLSLFATLSGAGLELVKLLQADAGLGALLDGLPPSPATTFVHGDLRWENVFVSVGGEIHLVDWEHAGLGDPAWDLGCFTASAVAAWIDSIPLAAGVDLPLSAAFARRDISALMRTVDAMFGVYGGECGLAPAADRRMRTAAFREAGVRLIHLAFDATADIEQISLVHALYVQVAEHILADPAGAFARLTGGVT